MNYRGYGPFVKHVREQVTVEDVLEVVAVNRRFLERRFRELPVRTSLQEIHWDAYTRSKQREVKQKDARFPVSICRKPGVF